MDCFPPWAAGCPESWGMGVRRNLLSHDAATEFQFLVITDLYKGGTEKLHSPLAVIGYTGTKHTAGTVLLLFSVVNNSSIFRFGEKSIFNIFLPFLPTNYASHVTCMSLVGSDSWCLLLEALASVKSDV